MVDLEAVCKVCDWRIERQRITVVSLYNGVVSLYNAVVSLYNGVVSRHHKVYSLQQLFVLNRLKQFRIE